MQKDGWTAFAAEVKCVITRLKDTPFGPDGPHPALFYLNRLKAATDRAVNPDMIAGEMTALERFWTENVNWCDPLSKDLEKIIILYTEIRTK